MRNRQAGFLLTVFLIPICVFGSDDPAVRIRKSELDQTPLSAGPLKITLSQFKEKVTFGDSFAVGNGKVTLEIANTSGDFATFHPQRFSFVNRDNQQIDILDTRQNYEEYSPASDIRIAPGAYVKETYRLKGPIRLPARLFYADTLLIVITE